MKSDLNRQPNKWRHGGRTKSIGIVTRRSRRTTSFMTKHSSRVMLSGFCFLLSSHSQPHHSASFFYPHFDNKKFILHFSSALNYFFLNHCHYQRFLMISDVCVYVSFSLSFYAPSIFCAVFSFLYDWNPHSFHLNHFHLLWTHQVMPWVVLFWKIKISN